MHKADTFSARKRFILFLTELASCLIRLYVRKQKAELEKCTSKFLDFLTILSFFTNFFRVLKVFCFVMKVFSNPLEVNISFERSKIPQN